MARMIMEARRGYEVAPRERAARCEGPTEREGGDTTHTPGREAKALDETQRSEERNRIIQGIRREQGYRHSTDPGDRGSTSTDNGAGVDQLQTPVRRKVRAERHHPTHQEH